MEPLDLEIQSLTEANPNSDVYDCAKLINRRQLFEPNRLRERNRRDEERISRHAASIQKYIGQPGSKVYFLRDKRSNEIVGWIGWLKPAANDDAPIENIKGKEAIDDPVDVERDMEAIQAVNSEKKALERTFFGDQPFWWETFKDSRKRLRLAKTVFPRTLSYVFVSPNYRRAGIGTRLVQHFVTSLQNEDPQAKVGFTSSPTGRYLYEKQGFRVVAWFNYTFDDIDEQGRPYKHRTRWPYMTNAFQHIPDADLESLGRREVFDGPANEDPEEQR